MTILLGTCRNNVLYSSWKTDDWLFGLGGNDTLSDEFVFDYRPPSNDVFMGGAGDDKIVSHDGSDILRGQGGDDVFSVSMHPGDTIVRGGSGNDVVRVYNFDGEIAVRRDGADLIIEDQGGSLTIKGSVERFHFDI